MNIIKFGKSQVGMKYELSADNYDEAAEITKSYLGNSNDLSIKCTIGGSHFIYEIKKGSAGISFESGLSREQREKILSEYHKQRDQITASLEGYNMSSKQFESLQSKLKKKNIRIDSASLKETSQRIDSSGEVLRKQNQALDQEPPVKPQNAQKDSGRVKISPKKKCPQPSEPTFTFEADSIRDAAKKLREYLNEMNEDVEVLVEGTILNKIKFTYHKVKQSQDITSTNGMAPNDEMLKFFESLQTEDDKFKTTLKVANADEAIFNDILRNFKKCGIQMSKMSYTN